MPDCIALFTAAKEVEPTVDHGWPIATGSPLFCTGETSSMQTDDAAAAAAAVSSLWWNKPRGAGSFPLALVHSPFCHSEMSDVLPHVTRGGVRCPGGAQRPVLPPTLSPRHRAKRFSISTHMPFIILGVTCHRARTPSPAKGGDLQRWSYTCFYRFLVFAPCVMQTVTSVP